MQQNPKLMRRIRAEFSSFSKVLSYEVPNHKIRHQFRHHLKLKSRKILILRELHFIKLFRTGESKSRSSCFIKPALKQRPYNQALLKTLTSGMPITPPFSIEIFNSGFDIKPFIASKLGASPIIVTLFALSTE